MENKMENNYQKFIKSRTAESNNKGLEKFLKLKEKENEESNN